MDWIVCQIGAREHYAVACALHTRGSLRLLVTDAWVPRWRDHPGLQNAAVRAGNTGFLASRIGHKLLRRSGWDRIIEDNRRFQVMALRHLERVQDASAETMLFAYSYAAKDLLAYARSRGWTTVLGQIDPGPEEERIVASLSAQNPQWSQGWTPAPPSYWADWRSETERADFIVVNSAWSRQCLLQEGIPEKKLRIIPLAYEPDSAGNAKCAMRNAKLHPTNQEPETRNPKLFQVLFLGQANVRKGIHDLAATARLLEGKPVRFNVVGPHPPLPRDLPANMRFLGPVPRSQAAGWYAGADLFVLPTHSDGFALTQLESMAHGLPVLATPCCGQVVEDGKNGWLLPPGQPELWAARIMEIASNPALLASYSQAALRRAGEFSMHALLQQLKAIAS